MKFNAIAVLGLMSIVAFGCRSVVATHDPATGQKTVRKVNGEWGMFTSSTDFEVECEKRGDTPPAGIKTWKEYWEWRFAARKQYERDPQKYIDCIKQRRLEAGLPDYDWSN